ncbi:MAG: 2-C-methyl-D-erythritol 4-phosphate cytidylyltransferase [Clostridia bacterium]|nr:2-C-methyl-D-erythritol 4-phosphate cytidylyltransferase [Clostridia bacterium]
MNIKENKLTYKIGAKPVIERTLEAFQKSDDIDAIILVASDKEHFMPFAARFSKVIGIVCGGESRAESVKCGLKKTGGFDIVAIHDGDRPFVSQKIISDTVAEAVKSGAAVPGIPVTDTIKLVSCGKIEKTVDRSTLCRVQTPQVFWKDLICNAYEGELTGVTDDASLVEKTHKVSVVSGSEDNIKLTTKHDLDIAEIIAKKADGDN